MSGIFRRIFPLENVLKQTFPPKRYLKNPLNCFGSTGSRKMFQQKSSFFFRGKDQATKSSNVDLSCVCMCEWIFSLGVFGLCCLKCALLFFTAKLWIYIYNVYIYIYLHTQIFIHIYIHMGFTLSLFFLTVRYVDSRLWSHSHFCFQMQRQHLRKLAYTCAGQRSYSLHRTGAPFVYTSFSIVTRQTHWEKNTKKTDVLKYIEAENDKNNRCT